ncbi:MAG: CDP-glycerol glycerophosphotransferase family protein [Calditrichaceae bacterium]
MTTIVSLIKQIYFFGKKITVYLLLLFPYWFGFFVPRNKNLWVFGAWFGERYSDNSRYVFEYVNKNEPSIKAVWLTRKKEIIDEVRNQSSSAEMIRSWKGYWMSCRAGAVIVTCDLRDVNRIGLSRAKIIQLWHGTPLKKIGFDDKITTNPDRPVFYTLLKKIWYILFPFMEDRWDMLISPSEFVSQRLSSAFNLDLSKIPVTGYPRGDVILNHTSDPHVEIFRSVRFEYNVKNIIFFLPTLRERTTGKIDLFHDLDFDAFNKFLIENDAWFFVKMHFYHLKANKPGLMERDHSRIWFLTERELPDINYALPDTDILITDYSSVFFDFVLLNRPVIFTPFDINDYLAKDREFYDDYDRLIPGPQCRNWDEVMEKLSDLIKGKDNYIEKRLHAQKLFNTFIDTDNSRRVVREINYILGKNRVSREQHD